MAQIPTYEPSVGIDSPPTIRLDPRSIDANSFGQEIYKGIGQVAEGINEQHLRQDKFDSSVAYNNAMSQLNNALYGDNGAFTLKGENAISKPATQTQKAQPGVYQRVTDTFNSIGSDAIGSLSTPQAQQMFQNAWQSMFPHYQKAAQSYENEQKNVAFDNNYKSQFDNSAKIFGNNILLASQIPQGQENPYQKIADQAIRDIGSNEIAAGQHYGLDNNVVADNINKRWNAAISSVIGDFIKNDNLDAAKKTMDYYADKLDAQTVSPLCAAIEKKEIPIKANQISDALFAKYGLDEKSGLEELRNNYENDPGFKSFEATYEARLTDERRIQADGKKKAMENTLMQLWGAPTKQDALNIINNSDLSASDKFALLSRVKNKFSLDPQKLTPAQRWAINYETGGGLSKNILKLREYNARVYAGDSITPEQQTEYDYAAGQNEKYWAISSGGTYDPNAGEKTQAEIFDQIGKMANNGYNQAQIEHALDAIAPKYGFDPQYFKDNADWGSLNWKTYESGDGQ